MKSQEEPPLSGPSEFGQSITVSVTPDVLSQDGSSQSMVSVRALDANAGPIRNLSLRGEIVVNGVAADFGSLSARNVVTDGEGRAVFVYTAPAAPQVTVDSFTLVHIVVTPIGSNFGNSSERVASIRLVPPGVVIPPAGLQPQFTFTPSDPAEGVNVLFDASASQGDIAQYRWNFADGRTATGRTVTHAFRTAGNYSVTLTLEDPFGRTASTTQQVTVGIGDNPTAVFVISPTDPVPGQTVHFNAEGSTPSPGRRISSYTWDFGDGSTGSGARVSHTYPVVGTYTVTLTVTDSGGRRGTVSSTVPVQLPGEEDSLTRRPGGGR
jgi:PKD repeat protein